MPIEWYGRKINQSTLGSLSRLIVKRVNRWLKGCELLPTKHTRCIDTIGTRCQSTVVKSLECHPRVRMCVCMCHSSFLASFILQTIITVTQGSRVKLLWVNLSKQMMSYSGPCRAGNDAMTACIALIDGDDSLNIIIIIERYMKLLYPNVQIRQCWDSQKRALFYPRQNANFASIESILSVIYLKLTIIFNISITIGNHIHHTPFSDSAFPP